MARYSSGGTWRPCRLPAVVRRRLYGSHRPCQRTIRLQRPVAISKPSGKSRRSSSTFHSSCLLRVALCTILSHVVSQCIFCILVFESDFALGFVLDSSSLASKPSASMVVVATPDFCKLLPSDRRTHAGTRLDPT